MRASSFALLLLFAGPAAALAQNTLAPGAIELYPTLEAVGVRVAYTGDDDSDASGYIEWRPAGAPGWTRGVNLVRILNRRFAGSVLWLSPSASIDVRAVLADPDGGGGTVLASTRTRDLPVRAPSGRTWWVATSGNDAAAGTAGAPMRTIQAAANLAQPGDEIRLRPGVYHQWLDTPRAGAPGAPIHLVGDAHGVILDGSDPAMLQRTDWRDDGGGVFSVPFAATTRLVCADSLQRLYKHATLADVRSGAGGVAQGWAIEGGRLHVRLEDGSNPAGHVMHVARYDQGVFVDFSDWRVVGLEIRYFGTTVAAGGVVVRAAHRCVVEGNHVHTIAGKFIWLRVGATDNLVESNLVRDPRIGAWPWAAVKAHAEEVPAISNRGGRGNVIRRNTVRGTFDGIDCAGSGTNNEDEASDCDISENLATDCGDDAFEPETIEGINTRIWKNRVERSYVGISIAPIVQGPYYVLYNTFVESRRSAFKHSLSSTGEAWICHNTAWSSIAAAPAVWPSGPYANVHFRNNVLTASGTPVVSDDTGESQTGCDFDGDVLFTTGGTLFRWKGIGYSTLAALRSGTGFEVLGRSGDPLFVSTALGDFTLLPGSPAIDGAIRMPGINDAFVGAGPDAGAFERTATGPDTTAPSSINDLRLDQ